MNTLWERIVATDEHRCTPINANDVSVISHPHDLPDTAVFTLLIAFNDARR